MVEHSAEEAARRIDIVGDEVAQAAYNSISRGYQAGEVEAQFAVGEEDYFVGVVARSKIVRGILLVQEGLHLETERLFKIMHEGR